jgi:hypothetical protein
LQTETYNEYQQLFIGTKDADLKIIIEYLCEELPYLWTEDYKDSCNHATDICRISVGNFEYIFDDCLGSDKLGVNPNSKIESRVVAAFGKSSQWVKKRDDYRLRGWLGPTNTFLGMLWDKGHYIAHCIGGAVDHAELNVFKQRRDLNRGWSEEEKIFRKMEKIIVLVILVHSVLAGQFTQTIQCSRRCWSMVCLQKKKKLGRKI